MEARVRFGVNYVPSRAWMHEWLALSPDRVRRDLEPIAELGLDHVRIMPLWPVLQPNRALIRQEALDDVRRVVDVAHELGLDASVDVIQGHLSSFDFLPSWMATWHDRNMFTHPEVVAGQVALVRALGERLADAPNLLGLTLGNELNQFSDGPHPHPWSTDRAGAERWLTTLLDAADDALPGRANVHSEYDAVWYRDGHPFVPAHAARIGAMTTVHSWIFNGTAQRHGGRSTASDRHAEYLAELSRAFALDPERPIWLQEVGAPSNCLDASETPGFLEATVRSATRAAGLWGVTWWSSHDVSRELVDFPDLEHSLGLVDVDGRIKPIGARLGEVAGELRSTTPGVRRDVAIVVEVDGDDTPVDRTSLSPGGAVFERWVQLCDDGVDPAFVTSRVAGDPAALAARGIRELVRPDLATTLVATYAAVNTVIAH